MENIRIARKTFFSLLALLSILVVFTFAYAYSVYATTLSTNSEGSIETTTVSYLNWGAACNAGVNGQTSCRTLSGGGGGTCQHKTCICVPAAGGGCAWSTTITFTGGYTCQGSINHERCTRVCGSGNSNTICESPVQGIDSQPAPETNG